MKKSNIISFVICAAMMFGTMSGFAFAAPADIEGHWAEETLLKWHDDGLIEGKGRDCLEPDSDVTRAEFAALMNRALDFTLEGDVLFTDVEEGAWYYEDVSVAIGMGYAEGFEDNTFKPNEPVTRQQAAKFLANALALAGGEPDFPDASSISEWAKPYVGALQKEGYVKGDRNGNFNPQSMMTRASAVVMLDRAMLVAKGTHVAICHTNDMHGFFIEGTYDGMGAAKLATLIDEQKALNPNMLVLDAGDAIQGNNLVTLNEGEAAIKIMNEMGYDAMAAGNHEFDYGQERLLELAGMADFPILSGNFSNEDGTDFLPCFVEFEMDGVNIGVFGVTTPETTYKSHPDNTKGLFIEHPVETAATVAVQLAERNDVVICLAHLGDMGEFDSERVTSIAEVDLIIDGHSHSTYETGKTVNDCLIVSAGEHTENLGIVELVVNDGEIVKKTASLITKEDAADTAEDEAVKAIVNETKAQNDIICEEVVASTPVALDGEHADVRAGETNLGNLITDALKDVSGADAALINGGSIRASIEAGDITKGEILTVLPFSNTVRVIELTGADLKLAIENGLAEYPDTNGAFAHISGMTIEFDSSKPSGERVVAMTVNGEALDEAKTYVLATNDYLVAGGDGYSMFTGKDVVGEYGAMDEVLIDYVNTNANAFDSIAVSGKYTDAAAVSELTA